MKTLRSINDRHSASSSHKPITAHKHGTTRKLTTGVGISLLTKMAILNGGGILILWVGMTCVTLSTGPDALTLMRIVQAGAGAAFTGVLALAMGLTLPKLPDRLWMELTKGTKALKAPSNM